MLYLYHKVLRCQIVRRERKIGATHKVAGTISNYTYIVTDCLLRRWALVWYYYEMQLPWISKKEITEEPSPLTAQDYENLGRAMEQVFISGYSSRSRLFLMSLYKGIGYGLGIFIGGTIIVALIAYGISQFETVPFLNQIIEPIRNTVQEVNGGPVYPATNQQ